MPLADIAAPLIATRFNKGKRPDSLDDGEAVAGGRRRMPVGGRSKIPSRTTHGQPPMHSVETPQSILVEQSRARTARQEHLAPACDDLAPSELAVSVVIGHLSEMTKRTRRRPASLPVMMMEMAWASWETVGRRSLMMTCGKCSPAEYSRMALEKMAATNRSASLLARSRKAPHWATLLAPWHARATSNARRLRRK